MPDFFDLRYVSSELGTPITGIIHIGAHHAEEAGDYCELGLKTIWFEAHPEYSKVMLENIAEYEDQIGFNILLSDIQNDSVCFWVTEDEYASSILKPMLHQEYHPHALISGSIQLESQRFDTWADSHTETIEDYNLLVLDTQGSEAKVWNGMSTYQNNFDAIISEYSTVEYYEGVPRIEDLDSLYHDFKRVTPKIGKEKHHGDALYIRKESRL